ncbi:MAG: heavy metal translocating P-type ATPase [Niabella sp.]
MEKTTSINQVNCFHCGESCSHEKIMLGDRHFCCEGCKMVYEILNQNDLCEYYDLNVNPGISQKIKVRADKFSFLDNEQVKVKLIQYQDAKQSHVNFYLPQMHCSSCLWLLENIHRINRGIVSSRVNFTGKEVFIVFENQHTSLRQVVETLTAIGYEPHISLQEAGNASASASFNKTRLLKIAIAGFCFANIMMMSLPEYFAIGSYMQEQVGAAFRYLNLLLAIPVFFYCSTEFFVSAWKGLKHGSLNIDAPIALAILITFGRSLYEVFALNSPGYFDSMSGIVFFMLVGRWAQDKTQKAIAFDRDFKSFFPIAVNVKNNEAFVPTLIENLQENDIIEVYDNELIPTDAILSKGKAEIDYSFVSGESVPVAKDIGEIIYAGGKQLGEKIELVVVKKVSQSYLTNLWNKDVFKEEKKEAGFLHALSNYFTVIVFIISGLTAAYWANKSDWTTMWNALTTILIIACPCALLLSSTFTNGNILRILSKNKLYLRHPDVIAHIKGVNHIVFDKTGTLTQSKKLKVSYKGATINAQNKILLASLLYQSTHPLSKAVFKQLAVDNIIPVKHFKNIPGKGIEGWIDETYIKAGSMEFVTGEKLQEPANDKSVVAVKIDSSIFGVFRINNAYRFGLKEMIQKLDKRFIISILSGDNDAEAANLKKLMNHKSEMLFNQSPEEKLEYIKYLREVKNHTVMMIGDGLNDAGALKQSNVGIAITEENNNFTPSCDGILHASRLAGLDKFLRFSASGHKIIMASFIVSIIYNIIGLYFAVQGLLAPVIAAILMPASSISIILLTYGLSEINARRILLKI